MKNTLNNPVNKHIAATVIATVALLLPIYWFLTVDWSNVQISLHFVFLGILWVLMSVGFILLILGKKGINVTSKEKDRYISAAYSNLRRRLLPVLIALFFVWLIWWFFKYAI